MTNQPASPARLRAMALQFSAAFGPGRGPDDPERFVGLYAAAKGLPRADRARLREISGTIRSEDAR